MYTSQGPTEIYLLMSQTQQGRNSLDEWQNLVAEYFTSDASFRTQVWHHTDRNQSKDFEISATVLGRYFLEHFNRGVTKISVSLGSNQTETAVMSSDQVPAIFTYHLENGIQVSSNAPNKCLLCLRMLGCGERYPPANLHSTSEQVRHP